jgi:hypothetical protein
MERPVIRRCSVFTGERSARKGVETTLGRKVGILFRYPINAKADQYSEQNESVTKECLLPYLNSMLGRSLVGTFRLTGSKEIGRRS